MAMRIEKSFRILAPADLVWAFLIDPRKVASCLPGAAITGEVDAQTFNGTMNVKVGPVQAAYKGRMRFERLDAAAREAEIAASGQETRGKGAADMRMTSRVVAISVAETEVHVTSDVNVVGVLAQFGRGMIQDVSDQMFEKFTQGMRRQLEPAGAAGAEAAATGAAAITAPGATAAPAPVGSAAPAPAAVAAPAAASTPAPAPSAAAPAAPARPPEENVLDVGAIGAKAAARAAGRTLRNPVVWVVIVLLAALLWILLT